MYTTWTITVCQSFGQTKSININTVNEYIRDYNYEKKIIINDLNKLLKTYKLYI